MRLDKYLKVSRVLKRRTVAKELADKERIFVNDRKAKASTTVKIGDKITVLFGNRKLDIEVLDMPKQASKEDAALMFKILNEEKIEEN